MNPQGNNLRSRPNEHKSNVPFLESNSPGNNGGASYGREPQLWISSNSSNNMWYESNVEHRQARNKTRKRSYESSWCPYEEGSSSSRPDENFFEGETRKKRFCADQPNFTYNVPTVPSCLDNSQQNVCATPSYGLCGTVSPNQYGTPPICQMNPPQAMNPAAKINATARNMNLYAYSGMPTDPSIPKYGLPNNECQNFRPKNIIHFTKCVLYPPKPNAASPKTRQKSPGCKTVYVGGLPENINEEIVREIFEGCGKIVDIRMNKKHYCHISFSAESCIMNALFYSGYRMKIGNKDDAPNTGWLHVDYAEKRGDQYDYECRQRFLQRKARHHERMEQDYFQQPTLSSIVDYSNHEASVLGKKLRSKETFQPAITTLLTWLERGECNKRNSRYFYSMIENSTSHIQRLMNEKLKYQEELNRAKLLFKQQMQEILIHYTKIEKIFTTASVQKIWGNFSKAQRKHLKLWKKQTEDIKGAHVEEVLNDRVEDAMDFSDGENEKEETDSVEVAVAPIPSASNAAATSATKIDDQKVPEESDDHCPLKTSENKLALVKSKKKQDVRNRQLDVFVKTLRSIQGDVPASAEEHAEYEAGLQELRTTKQKQDTRAESEAGVESSHEIENDSEANVEDITETVSFSKALVVRFTSAFKGSSGTGANSKNNRTFVALED